MTPSLDIWNQFSPSCTYFLKKQWDIYTQEKPFKGLRILSNLHLTKATTCKLSPLLDSGAKIYVTATDDLYKDRQIIDYYTQLGVYLDPNKIHEYQYDIVLDCGSALVNKVKPKFGFVELTQSFYLQENSNINFRYVDIDKTYLKEIENLYGTGDGFVRALKNQVADFLNKKFAIFGYGKVGQGIVMALKPYTKDIIIIEIDPKKIQQAEKAGFCAININQTDRVRSEMNQVFLAVTATGKKGFISRYFKNKDFRKVKKANMGTYDEWGDEFDNLEILGYKKPLNFILEEPTRMKFLDPIFYAHNEAIKLLVKENKPSGEIAFPKEEDQRIIQEWLKLHNFEI